MNLGVILYSSYEQNLQHSARSQSLVLQHVPLIRILNKNLRKKTKIFVRFSEKKKKKQFGAMPDKI